MVSKKKIIGATAGVAAAVAGIAAVKGKRSGSSSNQVYHVAPTDDGWEVKLENAVRATSKHGTKRDAVNAARALATSKAPSQLVIHRVDGSIQDTHTYELEE